MKRLSSALVVLTLLLAPLAMAGTTGFSLTLEEGLAGFPPVDQWIDPAVGAFDAAVGSVDVFSAETVKIIPDPAAGTREGVAHSGRGAVPGTAPDALAGHFRHGTPSGRRPFTPPASGTASRTRRRAEVWGRDCGGNPVIN